MFWYNILALFKKFLENQFYTKDLAKRLSYLQRLKVKMNFNILLMSLNPGLPFRVFYVTEWNVVNTVTNALDFLIPLWNIFYFNRCFQNN